MAIATRTLRDYLAALPGGNPNTLLGNDLTLRNISGGQLGGIVNEVIPGANTIVDATEPSTPIVGLDGDSSAAIELAKTALQAADVGTAAFQNVSAFATAAQGSTADSAVQPAELFPVATRVALKALATSRYKAVILNEGLRAGRFVFQSGNFSSQITADAQEGIYIKANDTASSAGAWVRVFSGSISARWFGCVANGSTDDSAAIQASIDFVAGLPNGGCVSIDGALTYAIASALTWKPKVFISVDQGTIIKATAVMDAMLQTGVGALNRVRSVELSGGVWDANFLAKRIFYLKDAHTTTLGEFYAIGCGAYVDGVTETLTTYIEVGHASQTTTCYEICIKDFLISRAFGASPSQAPANNYGIYSMNGASDSVVLNGRIRSVRKGIYGQLAAWVINAVHPWNYDPEDGAIEVCFHAISYGNVTFSNCYADLWSTGSIGFKFEGDSVPSRISGCTVFVGATGTDNTGGGFNIGSGVVVDAVGNSVICANASHRLAVDFSGTLTDLTVLGQRNYNVVASVGWLFRGVQKVLGTTLAQTQWSAGAYTMYLSQYDSGFTDIGTSGQITLSSGSGFALGLQQDLNAMVTLTRGLSLGTIVTKTADFTMAATENVVINNKSGSTCVATLPSAVTYPGRLLHFKNAQTQLLNSASSNVVPKIGGAAAASILPATIGAWAELVSNGTSWVIMKSGT